jgi:hypothetical protein
MRQEVNRNLLRHAAGQRFFCDVCRTSLDAPTTATADVFCLVTGRHLVGVIMCTSCLDKHWSDREQTAKDIEQRRVNMGTPPEEAAVRLDILDGREVF